MSAALVLERALPAFLAEAELGFPEAAHSLPFPREQGFEVEVDLQTGDVFQRAVLLEALAAIHRSGLHDLAALIDREADYLLGRQAGDGVGGWRYFPELVELPPDADDLAQCIRALLAAGRADSARRAAERPLNCYLEHGRTGPGQYRTWIVPPGDAEAVGRQLWWIERAWGQSVDCEVIANMVVALERLDPVRHSAFLAESRLHIHACLGADGSWPSTWYHGPFYPGWICSLALGPRSAAPRAWQTRLRALQNEDGGWGLDGASDAQNTALAIMTLGPADPAVTPALDWLVRAQEPDGLWPGVLWIRMELGRATGRPHTILSYGSRLIGAGYVLQALLQIEDRMPHQKDAHRRNALARGRRDSMVACG
ncbi:MAG: squalene cyclase [Alphaproteobacteria bacterium]|nr:squalene cyclase [Alphaproteobacteria bacterium]